MHALQQIITTHIVRFGYGKKYNYAGLILSVAEL